jgi:hypothetical protein
LIATCPPPDLAEGEELAEVVAVPVLEVDVLALEAVFVGVEVLGTLVKVEVPLMPLQDSRLLTRSEALKASKGAGKPALRHAMH